MNQDLYKKASWLAWGGLLLGFLLRMGVIVIDPTKATRSMSELLSLMVLPFIVWGAILALRSKNRHWAWVFILLPLNVIGLAIIFVFKDKSMEGVMPQPLAKP